MGPALDMTLEFLFKILVEHAAAISSGFQTVFFVKKNNKLTVIG